MKIEGDTLSYYIHFSIWHILVLAVWSILNFTFTYTKPALGSAMTKVAPIFLVIVFAHLGYKMGFRKKFNLNSVIFNGMFAGFMTGFLAGVIGVGLASYEFVVFLKIGGWTLGPGIGGLIIGVISFGIVIGVLRAVLGAIIAAIAWTSTRKH
jgi:hypothetical protein